MKTELIKAARVRKYKEAEGFHDNDARLDVELKAETSDKLDALAVELTQTSGVSLQTAYSTILEDAIRFALEKGRVARSN